MLAALRAARKRRGGRAPPTFVGAGGVRAGRFAAVFRVTRSGRTSRAARVAKEDPMKLTSTLSALVATGAAALLAQAAAAPVQVAVNPQPLPPIHGDATVRVAINPQPLPPGGDRWRAASATRPYIGETEKG